MGNVLADFGQAVPGITQMQHQGAVSRVLEQEAGMRNFQVQEMKREAEH